MRSFLLHPISFGHHDLRTSFLVQKKNDTPPSNESIYSSTITIEIHEMTSDMCIYIYYIHRSFLSMANVGKQSCTYHVHIIHISCTRVSYSIIISNFIHHAHNTSIIYIYMDYLSTLRWHQTWVFLASVGSFLSQKDFLASSARSKPLAQRHRDAS